MICFEYLSRTFGSWLKISVELSLIEQMATANANVADKVEEQEPLEGIKIAIW